jgi:hypothetical protein
MQDFEDAFSIEDRFSMQGGKCDLEQGTESQRSIPQHIPVHTASGDIFQLSEFGSTIIDV